MARSADAAIDIIATLDRLIDRARAQLEQLSIYRDRIALIEREMHVDNLYRIKGISASVRVILGLLMKREIVYRAMIYAVLYENRPQKDQPDPKVIDQFLYRLREVLASMDVVLHNSRGGSVADDSGYYLSPASKQKIKDFCTAPLQDAKSP